MFNFPGTSSHQMLHVWMYNLKTDKSTQLLSTLALTIFQDIAASQVLTDFRKTKNMSLKCQKFGAKNILISGLVYTSRINTGNF